MYQTPTLNFASTAKPTLRGMLLCLIAISLTSCSYISSKPGVGKAQKWTSLEGWQNDSLLGSWEALQSQCETRSSKPAIKPLCTAAKQSLPENPSSEQLRAFFENTLQPHRLHGPYNNQDGLITGYYEPLLKGSLEPDERYRYPLYAVPEELLIVDLDEMFPELEGKRVRGRVEGNKVVPFYDRAEIDAGENPLAGQELFWVDDPVDAFFLQIQGSGIVQLPDGSSRGVAYAQQNGHPYRAIGKDLIEQGEIAAADISLFTIRDWLAENPNKAQDLMNKNPSYVFFKDSGPATDEGPHGSLGVPLTTERSVAIDRKVVPLGSPLWLETTLPDGSTYHRLVFAQDTGGAIVGPVRADVFFGRGEKAAKLAGEMKQSGRLYLLKVREEFLLEPAE